MNIYKTCITGPPKPWPIPTSNPTINKYLPTCFSTFLWSPDHTFDTVGSSQSCGRHSRDRANLPGASVVRPAWRWAPLASETPWIRWAVEESCKNIWGKRATVFSLPDFKQKEWDRDLSWFFELVMTGELYQMKWMITDLKRWALKNKRRFTAANYEGTGKVAIEARWLSCSQLPIRVVPALHFQQSHSPPTPCARHISRSGMASLACGIRQACHSKS